MPSAHRYLVSFIRMGIVERDDETGRYDLGPGALQLGVAKLARFDVVGLSRPILEELSAEIGEPVALALWTDKGPICVSCVDTAGPIKLILRMGAVLPLLGSAAGLVFAAFHKSSALNKLRDKELDEIAKARKISQPIASSQLNAELAEIRIRGVSKVDGGVAIGVNAISVPIFDHTGSMVAALISGGIGGGINLEWDSIQAIRTQEAATRLSMRLGYKLVTARNVQA